MKHWTRKMFPFNINKKNKITKNTAFHQQLVSSTTVLLGQAHRVVGTFWPTGTGVSLHLSTSSGVHFTSGTWVQVFSWHAIIGWSHCNIGMLPGLCCISVWEPSCTACHVRMTPCRLLRTPSHNSPWVCIHTPERSKDYKEVVRKLSVLTSLYSVWQFCFSSLWQFFS